MSADSLRSEAARLRLGIRWGWIPVSRAVAWADEVIAACAAPPTWVIDVSLGRQLDPGEMAVLLAAAPGSHDEVAALRGTLKDLRSWIGEDMDRSEQAARWLNAAASNGDLDALPVGDVFSLDDAFALARGGYFGTLADAHDRVIRYIDGAA